MKQCLYKNALCEISTWYLFNKISEKNAFYLFSKRFIDFFFNVFLVNKNEIFYISTTFEEKKSIYPSIKLVMFAQVYLHNRAFTLYGRTKNVCYRKKDPSSQTLLFSVFKISTAKTYVDICVEQVFLNFHFLFFRASFVCARFFNALGIYFANSQSYNTIFLY